MSIKLIGVCIVVLTIGVPLGGLIMTGNRGLQ